MNVRSNIRRDRVLEVGVLAPIAAVVQRVQERVGGPRIELVMSLVWGAPEVARAVELRA